MTLVVTAQQDYRAYLDSWVHETKVPLAAMSLLVDNLDGRVDETLLTDLSLQLDKVDHDVEQVLYYSRLESFSRDYLLQDYPLKQIINAVVVDQRNSFIAKQLRFNVTGPDITVTTDDKWLAFILRQLVANAIKYTPAGGQIEAQLAHGEHEATLTIQDSGIGIPEDEQHRVFEKGFTGTNGRNANQKSTGLGLYLAAQLAEKLGHRLTLSATVGQGTAITVHFAHLDYYGDSGNTLTDHPLAK
jgi:toxin CptA